ncbi:cytochrome P450 [Suillus discolor]|uniref:Cytochrome P450 n=1 Tax=Suillus discolor TaxID=1912936 RepID=A0A9P7FGV6_9AGAM|nr:cytochrome P450 [Suillus discolor]KAG2115720.1 cytochrome P450 [Suillus discolor]
MLSTATLALGISCVIALGVASGLIRRRVYPLPLPPGPRPIPFLGNVLQLDTKRPWLTYTAWGKIYGNIIRCRVLGIDLIIINSETIAQDLLDKRSANYSSRPVFHANEKAGVALLTPMYPYGETLRQHRRIFHQVLKAEASVSYHEIYSRHANRLVVNLLGGTVDIQHYAEAYAGSIIVAVTYGHLAHGNESSYLTDAHELVRIVKQIVTPEKAAMFTTFPFLEKLPSWCFGVHSLIERSRELSQQLLNEPFDDVKAQVANGTASHSLISDFLSQPHDDADEDTMKAIALSVYSAGMETTATVLQTFLLAMVLFPDIQVRARAEIDQVVRHDKMPCLDDRASLPYIDAILREVMRWYPITPLGFAHATLDDDVYEGHFIPKGTTVMVNQWALSRNEDIFPDASRFDPSRHLTVDGKLKSPVVNHFAFGHGRRICPGRWFADNSMWTVIATILAVLRINHAKYSNGDKIEEPKFTTGLGIQPEPFYCSFESVSTAREGQIRAMMNSE